MAKKRIQKKKKVEVVFDPEKRKDFLTGFRKRKNERRKKAKVQLENTLKQEGKRIRQEIKDGITQMKKSFEPLKELTIEDKVEAEYEDDDVKVKIVELSTNELAAHYNLIGENRPTANDSEEEQESDSEDQKDDEMSTNLIPGMDLVAKRKKKKSSKSEENTIENKNKLTNKELKSKKDIDRLKKTKTLNKLKKSKAFKMKERLDNKINQKKIRRDRNNTLKSLPKSGLRKMKKSTACRFSKGRMVSKKKKKTKK